VFLIRNIINMYVGDEGEHRDMTHFHDDQQREPIVSVRGEKVALGPLHDGLLHLLERWQNNLRTSELGGDDPRPVTAETIAAEWGPLLRGERADWLGFAIYALPELRPIGLANVRDFSNSHGTAEIGITVGEVGERGKGFGTDAVRLLLDYAFQHLNVWNVWLDTASYNPGAIRAYEKAGFREIGRRRGARLVAGARHDIVLMDCTRDDFYAIFPQEGESAISG
jgi:RimJ/RimL family protein N-acetyltransferase